jgi:hypothetical protein
MKEEIEQPIFQIRINSQLDPRWSEWLNGMEITPSENGETLLSGLVVDQTALHGLLAKIRDMNLKLISVQQANRRDVTTQPSGGSGVQKNVETIFRTPPSQVS